jgi:hypothetical protein
MQVIKTIVTTLLFSLSVLSVAEDTVGESYVSNAQSFFLIENVNRQAEAWATCSAVWDIMAQLSTTNGGSKSEIELHSNRGSGAKMAVAMSFLSGMLSDDSVDQNQLNATWRVAQTALESMPDVQMTVMLADLEAKGYAEWLPDLGATMTVCMDNLEGQQSHIDGWRALASSGLLKFK